MNISLVSGWLPVVVECLAVVTLVLSVGWRSGAWRAQLGVGVPLAAVVTAVVALLLSFGPWKSSDFPRSAYLWGFTFVVASTVAIMGWSGAGWRRHLPAGYTGPTRRAGGTRTPNRRFWRPGL